MNESALLISQEPNTTSSEASLKRFFSQIATPSNYANSHIDHITTMDSGSRLNITYGVIQASATAYNKETKLSLDHLSALNTDQMLLPEGALGVKITDIAPYGVSEELTGEYEHLRTEAKLHMTHDILRMVWELKEKYPDSETIFYGTIDRTMANFMQKHWGFHIIEGSEHTSRKGNKEFHEIGVKASREDIEAQYEKILSYMGDLIRRMKAVPQG